MSDKLFMRKKKSSLQFKFSRFEGEKTRFAGLNGWMTNVHIRGKKYDTFAESIFYP